MNPVRLILGSLLVAMGCVALFAGDITENVWWLVAAAVALCGLAGLIGALRPSPNHTPEGLAV